MQDTAPKIKKVPITAIGLLNALVLWSKTYPPAKYYPTYPYWIDMLRDIQRGDYRLFHFYMNLAYIDLEDLMKKKFYPTKAYSSHIFVVDWCDSIMDIFNDNVKCQEQYVRDLAVIVLKNELLTTHLTIRSYGLGVNHSI